MSSAGLVSGGAVSVFAIVKMTARDARKLAMTARSLSEFCGLYRDPEQQCWEMGFQMSAQRDLWARRKQDILEALIDDYLGLVSQDK